MRGPTGRRVDFLSLQIDQTVVLLHHYTVTTLHVLDGFTFLCLMCLYAYRDS